MDPLETLGQGVCHLDPARSFAHGWLCHRCTGLYAGGLLGVAHAPGFARRLARPGQLVIAGLLIAPIAIDGLVLGRGSPVDVPLQRVISGVLAGLGSGLMLGALGWGGVRWPAGWARRDRARWTLPALVWGWLAIGVALAWAGHFELLDVAVAAGLLGLCLAGTAAALSWLRRGVRWLRGVRRVTDPPRLGLEWLVPLVLVELVVTTVTPARYKPTTMWVDAVLAWVGIGAG